MKKKKLILTILMMISIINIIPCVNAHSGRTDSNGGHKDNKNASGLGSYHYHCGGHPAHLHTNGVCPYKSGGTESSSSKASSAKSTTPSSTVNSNKSTLSGNKTGSAQSTSSNKKETNSQITKTSDNAEQDATTKIIDVENISIKNTEREIEIGSNLKMEAIITPDNATNKNISWSSSDKSIASIDAQGNITPLKVGTVTIIAKSNNQKMSSIDIKINQLPEGIKIINDITEMEIDSTINLETTLTPQNAKGNLIWNSNNNEVATVNSLGKVTAKKEGEVVITVKTENGKFDEIIIKVKNRQETNNGGKGGIATVLTIGVALSAAYLGYRPFK